MEIKVIRTDEDIINTKIKGNSVLEELKDGGEGLSFSRYFMYDPLSNTRREIAPDIIKYDLIPVFNCIWDSPDVYFATFTDNGENQIDIAVYCYSQAEEKVKKILTFSDSVLVIDGFKMIKIFVVSEDRILVQTEHKKDWEIQALMGNIEFVLSQYDLESGQISPVKDANLLNNGINSIIPLSKTDILVKTGYPFLEDSRISGMSEEEALIESIYVGSLSMFISSLQRDASVTGAKLLDTVYFDKGILHPDVKDEYCFFSEVHYRESRKDTIFYNFVTGETLRCTNDIVELADISNAFIVNNIPYIRSTFEDRTEFLNIKTSEADCIFYEETFITVVGKLFVFSSIKKGKPYVRLYRHPGLDLILEEPGVFQAGCCNDTDYYLYIKIPS